MTCHEFWNEMPELARGGELPDHAQECPSCAALLHRQRALAAGLSRMAEDPKNREAPPALERRLLKVFRAQSGAGLQPGRRHWAAWAAAAAVVLVAIFWTAGHRGNSHASAALQAMADLSDPDTDFIPLPYGSADPNNAVPDDDVDLVRVEVPRTALIALGLPVAEVGATRVEAEVALGADGTMEGIRIVQ